MGAMFTSRDGNLKLEDVDIINDQNRYQRLTGKACPLDIQQTLDHSAEFMQDDDMDDTEFVESIDKYATERLAESVKTLEAGTSSTDA